VLRTGARPPEWKDAKAHVVQVGFPQGTPVGLILRDERGVPAVDVSVVQQDGTVTLYAPSERLTFVDDPKRLLPYPSGGRINALLVRLTGTITGPVERKYDVVRPTRPASDAK